MNLPLFAGFSGHLESAGSLSCMPYGPGARRLVYTLLVVIVLELLVVALIVATAVR